jgi:chromosome partitioning protein
VTRVLAIANQKGGVGKTTTAVNLAASLAAAERSVLLIDGDPQGNATSGVGVDPTAVAATTYELLLGLVCADSCVIRGVQFKSLDVIPATPDLAGAEVELVGIPSREFAMRRALAPLLPNYEIILIDCPPSLGLITLNMLTAADGVLIPLQCEYFALEGISHLMKTIGLVQRSLNPALCVDAVLLTMFDSRLNLSKQVATDARAYFGDRVFETAIPRNVRLAEAPSFGKPIITYDVASPGSTSYMSVAKELMARL